MAKKKTAVEQNVFIAETAVSQNGPVIPNKNRGNVLENNKNDRKGEPCGAPSIVTTQLSMDWYFLLQEF